MIYKLDEFDEIQSILAFNQTQMLPRTLLTSKAKKIFIK